jgi:lipopolysaccharide export system protein LptA
MKKVYVCLLTTGVLLTMITLAPVPNFARNQATVSRLSATSPSDDAKDAKTFTGKIAQDSGKFILRDDENKVTYQLDDQDKAKKFDGQEVKITGTLDPQSNTIHVMEIQSA